MAARGFRAFARGTVRRGTFLRRLNRFVLEAETEGAVVTAHLPNPGRLWEILFPGTELALVPTPQSPKLSFKVAAARRNGRWVNLDTIRTNALARHLLEEGRVPGLSGWEVFSSEVPHNNSRFDFLLGRGTDRLFLEVKSCTLFQGPMSMFPDAVTERGRRHLLELAALGPGEPGGAVLVVSQGPESRFFLPDYHTDRAFAEAFLETRGRVGVHAVSVGWGEDLSLAEEVRPLEVPWDVLARTDFDAGAWIALLGGEEAGLETPYAAAAGVEHSGLDRACRALARHFGPSLLKVLPVRGYRGGLDRLEEALSASADRGTVSSGKDGVPMFGFSRHPLQDPLFVDTLLDFRLILQPLGKMP